MLNKKEGFPSDHDIVGRDFQGYVLAIPVRLEGKFWCIYTMFQ